MEPFKFKDYSRYLKGEQKKLSDFKGTCNLSKEGHIQALSHSRGKVALA